MEEISETIKVYGKSSFQYHLSSSQKGYFFLNVLDGEARKFFFGSCREFMDYSGILKVMMIEYVSRAIQLQVKGSLETLRLKSFIQEKKISDASKGLTKLFSHINEFVPQFFPDFRSDAHKGPHLIPRLVSYFFLENNISRLFLQ